ncbi:MAG: SDR family NAD(P)-dependent oxidoreductase [Pseudomonadota bacterium]
MKLDSSLSAIVTGGASGLGAATARMLAAEGVKVTVADVADDKGKAVADDIGGIFARCDVTDEASCDEAIAAARAAHGQERILINCAGIALGKRLIKVDRETGSRSAHDTATFARTVEINLIGTFRMIAKSAVGMAALDPANADGERGVIVCTASVAAEDGQIGQAAYGASKAGVQGMTLPVARDLAQSGIRVCTILPGLFETPMFDGLPEDAKASLAATVPFPSRLGRPEEYASLARQICENTMLNGESIRLDGSIRLAPR